MPLLMEEINKPENKIHGDVGGQRLVAEKLGIPERTLYRILNGCTAKEIADGKGKGVYIKFSMLDRILCGMRKLHLFYVPAEQGGFKDIYEGDTTFDDRFRVRDALSYLDPEEFDVEEIIAAYDRIYQKYHRTLEAKNELEIKIGNLEEKYDSLPQ